jgi:hypothetical protein
LLRDLKSEAASLLILAHQLGNKIETTLAGIELSNPRPTLRETAIAYMAAAPSARLRADLIEARGARAAANFRTRLNGDLEQLAGRRHPVNGRAHVGNGNGTAL